MFILNIILVVILASLMNGLVFEGLCKADDTKAPDIKKLIKESNAKWKKSKKYYKKN